MKKLTHKAKELLINNQRTCVICLKNTVYESETRGVAPLLSFVDSKVKLKGGCAADKVVGAGAAFLYVLLEVSEVYAAVISERARSVLEQNGISVYYDKIVPKIENRERNGFCPIETAVMSETNPADALIKIRETIINLSK